ncbi:hypothetical protein D1007_13694 [Hordeum vulgare]|nr:hypothetical protein D1007_13694 [Hordeum vulgare]
MASLPQPLPYGGSYYPSAGAVRHASGPAPDEGGGSFGPVLVVLAVISFLAVAACIAGRLCGRRSSSSREKSSAEQQSTADAEKGLGTAKYPAVMRPLPSSRATVHDMDDDDDVFEIKFAHVKPPAGGVGETRRRWRCRWRRQDAGAASPAARPTPAVRGSRLQVCSCSCKRRRRSEAGASAAGQGCWRFVRCSCEANKVDDGRTMFLDSTFQYTINSTASSHVCER